MNEYHPSPQYSIPFEYAHLSPPWWTFLHLENANTVGFGPLGVIIPCFGLYENILYSIKWLGFT